MLQKIFETKTEEVEAAKRRVPLAELIKKSEEFSLNHRFREALSASSGQTNSVRLIAEVKKASPSQGLIRPDFDPAQIAFIYASVGVHALSVLTDERYFQGNLFNIALAKSQCNLPILRKDFIADPYQVYESKVAGADAILLIVAGLDQGNLIDLHQLATDLGLDVLVEVHSEPELERAVELGAPIIGVNNRDLATFQVDLAVSERLIPKLPAGTISVCESALSTHADVLRAQIAGANAVLIGTSFCSSPDIGAKVKEVMGW